MTAGWLRFHRRAGRAAVAAAIAPLVRPRRRRPSGSAAASSRRWTGPSSTAGPTTIISPPSRPSCKAARAILRGGGDARGRPIFRGLHEACTVAATLTPKDAKEARDFFEQNFRPVRITPNGETAGFLTGYYEPIVDGSREPSDEFAHPLYRTPAGLLRGGKRLKAASFGRSKVGSKIAKGAKATKKAVRSAAKKVAGKVRRGGRRLVSFYDRAAIEDGVLKGRNLEIVYLKDPIELVLHPHPGFGARASARRHA